MKDMAVDFQCDVYSFAVIMWELITKAIPWNGLSLVQVPMQRTAGTQRAMQRAAGIRCDHPRPSRR
jgi:hypothetical protein